MSDSRTIAPYGTWKSPITPQLLTSKAISFGDIATATGPSSSSIVYTENRPSERGRAAAIRIGWPLDASLTGKDDVTRGDYDARSAVHEYGGGAIAASSVDGSIIFTDFNGSDCGVYRVKKDPNSQEEEPERITPSTEDLLYADFQPHPVHSHLILAIQEDHSRDEVYNTLVLINANDKKVTTLHAGFDFYTSPAWSVDGDFVAWINWNHPSMPFWATEGWVARLDASKQDSPALVDAKPFAGHLGKEEVIAHPVWMPDTGKNTLVFTSDRTEFSLPYQVNVEPSGAGLKLGQVKSILSKPIDSDFIVPPWTLNNSSFVALTGDLLACVLIRGSSQRLALLSVGSGKLTEVHSPFGAFSQLRRISDDEIVLIASSSTEPSAIYVVKIAGTLAKGSHKLSRDDFTLLKQSSDLISSGTISSDYLSVPEDIEFPTTLPDGTPTTAYGILFPPTNPNYSAPAGSSPPCIFKIHGGPTSSASKGMSLQTNYWTSKGYSVCFVDYGGSTGHGRSYMLRLMNNWGLVDVLDCVSGAKFLGSPTAQTQNKRKTAIQEMTKTAQAQFKSLEERFDSNGSVRITLENHQSQWGLSDLLALPVIDRMTNAFSKLSPLVGQYPIATAVVVFLSYLAVKATSVLKESVFASPNFGLQMETTRGLRLPFISKKHQAFLTSTSVQHIPRDRMLDLVLNTAVKGWDIKDYLAVGVRSRPMCIDDAPKAGETATLRSLQVLFPHLEPKLPIVERIYKTLYPVLFPSSSNPVANAAKPLPTLQRTFDDSYHRQYPSSTTPRADPNALIISGGSAGGFTVLACLTNHPTTFSAGCSSYGISELTALAKESHKFESRYPLRLLGGTPEEVPEIYRERSPLYKAGDITSPVLLLQGSEDKVVPPDQARSMFDAISSKPGGKERVKYIEFEGEAHGFRKAENIIRALEEEEEWYRVKLGLGQKKKE